MITITIPHANNPGGDPHRHHFDIGNEDVSDGYHTMAELYEHRIELFIALCRYVAHATNPKYFQPSPNVWRSRLHSGGTGFDGWFLLGVRQEKGHQVTYHLPESAWERTEFALTLERAPEWDGHTSQDVLERLKTL